MKTNENKPKVEFNLLPHQLAFLKSEKRHTGLLGGYGSGKTFGGVFKTVIMKMKLSGINVAYYLPTYTLIKDVAFPVFSEILGIFGIPFKLNHSDKEFITPLGKIILRSMDNPDLIVGYEVGYSLIDEADILPMDKMNNAFIKIVARNRKKLPNNEINKLDFVSTPEGFKFLYNFFVKKHSENKLLIKAKTKDNKHVPDGYIDALKDEYSPEQLEAYLNGEFVNLTSGTVYNAFDRMKHFTARQVQENDKLHIGMDFNITNMNAVVHVVEGNVKFAVDEFAKVYDTFTMARLIKDKYPNHKITIYPDASGNSRSTSGKSDHQILRESGFQVIAPTKNPNVRDRVNAVNREFRDMNYLVNVYQCPTYAEALEKQTYKNGEPDKTSGYDHITEAGGYFIFNSGKSKIKYGIT